MGLREIRLYSLSSPIYFKFNNKKPKGLCFIWLKITRVY